MDRILMNVKDRTLPMDVIIRYVVYLFLSLVLELHCQQVS